jgi:hypothetical protein
MSRLGLLPAFAAAMAVPAIPAAADVVHLRTGGTLEGRVTKQEDRVRVETTQGVATFGAADVDRIEAREAPQDELLRRKQALPPGDAGARVELARWCREKRMDVESRSELEEAVRVDPDHAEARRELGHVRWNGAWMTEAAAKQAQGLVLVDGAWLPADAAEARTARKAEETRRQEIVNALRKAAQHMASPAPRVREQGYAEAVETAARFRLPAEVKSWADDFKAKCDRAWLEVESRRVFMELRVMNVEFQGFRRLLIDPPVNAVLQLPFQTTVGYQGSILVPAVSR